MKNPKKRKAAVKAKRKQKRNRDQVLETVMLARRAEMRELRRDVEGAQPIAGIMVIASDGIIGSFTLRGMAFGECSLCDEPVHRHRIETTERPDARIVLWCPSDRTVPQLGDLQTETEER